MDEEPPPEGYRGFRLQPAGITDHIASDGKELTRAPYPFIFTQDGDLIGDDFWGGDALQIIGCSKSLKDDNLDLPWDAAILDPAKILGMYVITINDGDEVRLWYLPIQNVTVVVFTDGRWKVTENYQLN